jgi:ribosome-binding factor A
MYANNERSVWAERTAGTESKRQARVSQLLTSELATIIRQGHQVKMGAKPLADSLRAKISVVDVSVSPDLRNARIFISVYGDRLEKREAYAWCVRNSSGIRFALSQRLKDMKGVPELTFQQTDVSAAVDVMHLIDQVHKPFLHIMLLAMQLHQRLTLASLHCDQSGECKVCSW